MLLHSFAKLKTPAIDSQKKKKNICYHILRNFFFDETSGEF